MHCRQPPPACRRAAYSQHRDSSLKQCMHSTLPQPCQAGRLVLLRRPPDRLLLWRHVHAVCRWFNPGAHAVVSAAAAAAAARRTSVLPFGKCGTLLVSSMSVAAARRLRTGTCLKTSQTSTPAPTTSWFRTAPTRRCPPPVCTVLRLTACCVLRATCSWDSNV